MQIGWHKNKKYIARKKVMFI